MMPTHKPWHFAIPIFDRWLLHSPLHDVTALVNHGAYLKLLQARSRSDLPGPLRELARDLDAPPVHRPTTLEGPFDPKLLAIVTTRGCNIDCVYCDFGGPTSAKTHMAPELAVRTIDWMASHLVKQGRNEFLLHFFGGEPFISGDLVDIAVHRTRLVCAQHGLRPRIDVSTNGVFSAARAAWIGEYFDSVVLSFDGPPEFQNRTRSGVGLRPTFDHVDRTARCLRDARAELCLRVCITGESVGAMVEMTRWMAETYAPAVINFEPLTENELTQRADLRAADPFDFARAWIAAKAVADAHGIRLVYSATEDASPRLSSCPVGSDALVVTPEGTINGCYLQPNDWLQRGMDMRLGIMGTSGPSFDLAQIDRLRELIVEKPRCEKCFCQWSCAGGCHVSNTHKNCSTDYVPFCHQTRVITACLLLEELGETDLVSALLADRNALTRLATHPWDARLFERNPASSPELEA